MSDEAKLKAQAPAGRPRRGLPREVLLTDLPRLPDLTMEGLVLWQLLESGIEANLDALLDAEDRETLVGLLERLTQRLEEMANDVESLCLRSGSQGRDVS
jgi:hypothetical protein